MESYFATAGIIAVVYAIIKFIEMRFLTKEPKPIKEIIKETIIVFISAIVGNIVFQQIEPLTNKKIETSAFKGKADF